MSIAVDAIASPTAVPADIILSVNGVPVQSSQDTLTRIAIAKPGGKVKLTGIRGAEKFESEVEVSERPRSRS